MSERYQFKSGHSELKIIIKSYGALTAKPQAFHGRPWEYDETFALDFVRYLWYKYYNLIRGGTAIIRILPRNS